MNGSAGVGVLGVQAGSEEEEQLQQWLALPRLCPGARGAGGASLARAGTPCVPGESAGTHPLGGAPVL